MTSVAHPKVTPKPTMLKAIECSNRRPRTLRREATPTRSKRWNRCGRLSRAQAHALWWNASILVSLDNSQRHNMRRWTRLHGRNLNKQLFARSVLSNALLVWSNALQATPHAAQTMVSWTDQLTSLCNVCATMGMHFLRSRAGEHPPHTCLRVAKHASTLLSFLL